MYTEVLLYAKNSSAREVCSERYQNKCNEHNLQCKNTDRTVYPYRNYVTNSTFMYIKKREQQKNSNRSIVSLQ